jgi:hypothetical protein
MCYIVKDIFQKDFEKVSVSSVDTEGQSEVHLDVSGSLKEYMNITSCQVMSVAHL